MKLPGADRTVVEERKITEYLLSPHHQRGSAKAEFFGRFGFSLARWSLLRDALIAHAQTNDVTNVENTKFGNIFEVNGRLKSPDGRNPWVLVHAHGSRRNQS